MPVGRGSKELGRRGPARQSIGPGGSAPQGSRHRTVCGVCLLNERIRCAGRKCRRRHARRCHCRPPLRRGGPGKPPRTPARPRRHRPAPPLPPCARSALSLLASQRVVSKGKLLLSSFCRDDNWPRSGRRFFSKWRTGMNLYMHMSRCFIQVLHEICLNTFDSCNLIGLCKARASCCAMRCDALPL